MGKLREQRIIVTAVHNHWLFDEPLLMYLHFESIDRSLSFASKVRNAMRVLISEDILIDSKISNQKIDGHFSEDFRRKKRQTDSSSLCDEFNQLLGGTMHT